MPSGVGVIRRMDSRTEELSRSFQSCLQAFDRADTFSGPSLYFHAKAIGYLHSCRSSVEAVQTDEFFDWVYATLASWGMHRMGPGKTKLRELPEIRDSVRAHLAQIRELQDIRLVDVPQPELGALSRQLWHLVDQLKVSVAEAKIVANTKVLHHVLPELLPPIDRSYTFNFFYNRTMLTIPEGEAFREMFLRLHRVITANRDIVRSLVGSGWNTSETKVLDNALVGFVIEHLRPKLE